MHLTVKYLKNPKSVLIVGIILRVDHGFQGGSRFHMARDGEIGIEV